MFSKKFLTLILTLIILASFSFGAFAASGQGYFGSGKSNGYEVEETNDDEGDYDDDYDDDDDNDDNDDWEDEEDVVTVPPAPKDVVEIDEVTYHMEVNYWKGRNLSPERKSVDAAKVIKSYQLDKNVARILLDKHRDAEKTQIGKREQAQRYQRIVTTYPYDYLAAYKAGLLNYEMGRYSTALKWAEASLQIYPNYVPASTLRNKARGAMNRNR